MLGINTEFSKTCYDQRTFAAQSKQTTTKMAA